MEPRRSRRTLEASLFLAGPEGLHGNTQLAFELFGDPITPGSCQFPDCPLGYLTHPENLGSKS